MSLGSTFFLFFVVSLSFPHTTIFAMMSLSETVVSGHIMFWKLSCFLDMGVCGKKVPIFQVTDKSLMVCRRVRHKNVVQFIGACTKPPNLCIVTGRYIFISPKVLIHLALHCHTFCLGKIGLLVRI